MALTKCKECGESVSTKADACPKCGAKQNETASAVANVLGMLFGLGLIGYVVIAMIGEFADLEKETQRTPDEMLQELARQCKANAAEAPQSMGDKQMLFESCVAGGKASLRAKGIIE